MAEKDAATLFTNALNVINTALEKHSDETPYRQMIEASGKALADRNLGVAIYEDDPDSPFDFVTIRFANGRFEIVSHGADGREGGSDENADITSWEGGQ